MKRIPAYASYFDMFSPRLGTYPGMPVRQDFRVIIVDSAVLRLRSCTAILQQVFPA